MGYNNYKKMMKMTTLNNKKLKKLLKSKSRVKIEQNPDLFYKEFLKSECSIRNS